MAACSVGNTLDDEPDSVGATERTESACQQANTKAGTSGQAGRLFVSTRPQSKLPLTTHASWLLCGRCPLVQTATEKSGRLTALLCGAPLL